MPLRIPSANGDTIFFSQDTCGFTSYDGDYPRRNEIKATEN